MANISLTHTHTQVKASRKIALWLLSLSIWQKCLNFGGKKKKFEKNRRGDSAYTLHRTGALRKCRSMRRRHSCLNWLSNWKRISISKFGKPQETVWSLTYLTTAASANRAGTQTQVVLVGNPPALRQHFPYFIKPVRNTRECICNVFLPPNQQWGLPLTTLAHIQLSYTKQELNEWILHLRLNSFVCLANSIPFIFDNFKKSGLLT